MIKNELCSDDIKESEKEISLKYKIESPKKENNIESNNKLKLKKLQSEEIPKNKNKINTTTKNDSDDNPLKNIDLLNKVKTFNIQRKDRFGNMIIHGGNHKVTFIDKVTKKNFTEVVKIENFKQYNKMEESSNNKGNNCCLLL